MMLVLQIAAGIVLAYLIIRFRHSIWALTLGLLVMAVIVIVVVGAGAGVTAFADSLQINWEKVLTVIVVLPCFALMGVGAYGLLTIFHVAFNTERPRAEGDGCFPVLVLFGFLNAFILTALGLLFPTNPIAQAAGAINEWSRASGYKDLGSMLFGTFLMATWPWLILLALYGIARLRGSRSVHNKTNEPTGDVSVPD